MGLSKSETAQMHLNRQRVVELLKTRGPLMLSEILQHVPGLKRSAMGHMIRLSMIIAEESGERDKNYNQLMIYSIPGEGYQRERGERAAPAEKQLRLEDVWPLPVPAGNWPTRHITETHSASNAVYRQPVLQSGHVNLINVMAG